MKNLLLTIILLQSYCGPVVCQQVGLISTCPASGFTDGQQAIVNCTVLGNVVNGIGCVGNTITSINFVFVATGTSTTINSRSAIYDIAAKTCLTTWTNDVRCESYDSQTNIFNYQIRFTVNGPTHSQQDLICTTNCFHQDPLNQFFVDDSSTCSPIPIAATTTTPTTATTEATTTTQAPTQAHSPDQPKWWEILLIVAACVLIVLLIVILLFVWPIKKRRVLVDPKKQLCREERIRRAKQLIGMETPGYVDRLKDIENEAVRGSCCCPTTLVFYCCSCCPVTLKVGGNDSIKDNGQPEENVSYDLHVLVTCRNIIFFCRAVTLVKELVNEMNPGSYGPSGEGGGHEAKPSSKRSNAVHAAKYTGSSVTYENSSVTNGAKTEARVNLTLDDSRTAADGESQHKAFTPDTS